MRRQATVAEWTAFESSSSMSAYFLASGLSREFSSRLFTHRAM